MPELFPPKDLVNKCFHLVTSTHARLGFGDLLGRIATKEAMVTLATTPRMLHVVGSVSVIGKFRTFAWVVGIFTLLLGLVLSRLWLVGPVLALVADRLLAKKEHEQYMFLAAVLLAMDVLATDFAGWGSALPKARRQALTILAHACCRCTSLAGLLSSPTG